MSRYLGGLMVSLLLVLIACSVTVPGQPGQPTTKGYLAQGATYVDFIQVTRAGDQISGSLQEAQLNGTQISNRTLPYTGLATGNNISITFNLGLGTTTNVSGHFDGDRLVLFVPQPSGAITSETLAPSDSAHYNSALSALYQQQTTLQQPTPQPSASLSGSQTHCAVQRNGEAETLDVSGPHARDFCRLWLEGTYYETSHLGGDHQICSYTSQGDTITVWDSGGAYYGGQTCEFLKMRAQRGEPFYIRGA